MLDQEELGLAVTDQEAIVRMRHDCDKRLDDLREEFNPAHAEKYCIRIGAQGHRVASRRDPPKNWTIPISKLLHEWIYHDLNHLRRLWPDVGNMQGFYPPMTARAGIGSGLPFLGSPQCQLKPFPSVRAPTRQASNMNFNAEPPVARKMTSGSRVMRNLLWTISYEHRK
jgi:hypothetical protein